jgi:biotin carboxylase
VDAFVFVESNTTGSGETFIERARMLGLEPWVLTRNAARYSFLVTSTETSNAPRVLTVDTHNRDALLEAVRRLARQVRIRGVFSSSEYAIASAAWLARVLGLPGADPNVISRCRRKPFQRRELARSVPELNPAYGTARTAAEACSLAEVIGLPVIVKPPDASGSVGVRCCASLREVESHAQCLLQETGGTNDCVLVEELIEGREYSVEILSGAVVGMTDKYLGHSPWFVETGHDFPTGAPPDVEHAVVEAALRASSALGLSWGPIHAEVRMSAHGPRIIEINPRLAGGRIPDLIEHALGVDVITATLRLALGGRPSLQRTRALVAGVRFILTDAPGRLCEITGFGQLARAPYVLEARRYRADGDELVVHGDFRDRIGHVIACATERATLLEALSTLMASVVTHVSTQERTLV